MPASAVAADAGSRRRRDALRYRNVPLRAVVMRCGPTCARVALSLKETAPARLARTVALAES